MNTRFSLLLAAESEDSAARLAEELARSDLHPAYALARTAGDFSAALAEEPWDMVAAEASVGGMHWTEALALARAWDEDAPFVLLLETASADEALAALGRGADDVLTPGDWRTAGVFARLAREAGRRRELARSREELRREEQASRSLIDNSMLGIFRLAPWGGLTAFNPALVRILGFEGPEALEAALDRDAPLPGLDGETLEALLFLVRTQQAVTDYEARVARPDGSMVWVSLSAHALMGDEGEISAIEGVMEDIQRRKAMESMIINAKQEWEATFDSVPDLIFILDADQRLRRMNMALASRLGRHPRDLVGSPCRDILDRPDEPPAVSARIREMAGAASGAEELHIPALGGWFLVTVSPFFPGGDTRAAPAGSVVAAHDVSRRKELEIQLRQSQKLEAIGTLAGGIAHDFNNILGVMMGYTEMNLEDAPEPSPARRRLEQVLCAGRRARDLVRQILTFSRQEELDLQPLRLDAVIRETAKLLRASLPAGVEIALDLDPDVGAVRANLSQIHQVLMNLCTNAAHAMREDGGELRIGLAACGADDPAPASHPGLGPGPFARLTVEDQGHGIPPEILDKVFDPFFTTKGPDEGTGMGLAMVHGIVTGHGGAVDVASEPGRGTRFGVLLPVAREAAARGGGPVREEDRAPGGRALFVDDEPELAAIGRDMLASLGFEARSETDPRAALARFSTRPDGWDLVVTDQTMPGMSGLDLARRLLELRPDLALVVCTGYSEALSADGAEAAGVGAVLQKPVLREDLARAVGRAMARSRHDAEAAEK